MVGAQGQGHCVDELFAGLTAVRQGCREPPSEAIINKRSAKQRPVETALHPELPTLTN